MKRPLTEWIGNFRKCNPKEDLRRRILCYIGQPLQHPHFEVFDDQDFRISPLLQTVFAQPIKGYSSLFSACCLWLWFCFGKILLSFCLSLFLWLFVLILCCRFLDVLRALRGCQPSLRCPDTLCIILMYIELCLFLYINNSETRILF